MNQDNILVNNNKYIWLLYICVIVVNVFIGVQLFQFEFLPLCDWIPHIYNSGIIHELLFHSESRMHEYYIMDYSFYTNLTDHLLLAGIMSFTGGAIASQIVILFVVFIMQAGFFLFLKTLKFNPWWTLLIIPFILNGTFISGMINFNIGIGLMFFLLSFWVKYYEKPSIPVLLILMILPILLYVTHIFVYGIAIFAVGVFICVSIIFQLRHRKALAFSLKSLALLIVSNIIPGIIFFNYFFTQTGVTSSVSLGTIWVNQVIDFFNLQFLVGYNSILEGVSLRILMITLWLLIALSLISRFVPALRKHHAAIDSDENKRIYNISNIIVISLLIIALLLFPGSIKGAGNFVDKRIQTMLCMFCLIGIVSLASKAKYEKLLLLAIIPVLISANIHKKYLFTNWHKKGYPVAEYLMELSNNWDEYSSAMVIKGDIPWFMFHYGNALGIENKVICYENYETHSGHFCVRRAEDSPITDIQRKAIFYRPAKVPWEMILPDNAPDYILILSHKERVELPDEVSQLYMLESEEKAGIFLIEVLRKDPPARMN